MANRLAILCPGQGGQHPRMLEFATGDPRTKDMLDQWPLESVLGMPLDAALEDRAALFSNRIAQPLIVAAAAAAWHAIRELVPTPALVAGYSIGELSAYVVAGALAAEEAIGLAACRARLMDECSRSSVEQRLMSVSGIATARLGELLPPDALFISIETGEDSAIIGGARDAAIAAETRLRQMGCRVNVLPVEVASHTPFMCDAAGRFLVELQRHPFTTPVAPVLSGISGTPVYRKEDAQATLARQIAEKIRWKDCMDACAEAGVTIALELGPGSALSRMLRERHSHIECRSTDDFRSADGVARWIRRHFD